jgi:bilin biosynthesis protein
VVSPRLRVFLVISFLLLSACGSKLPKLRAQLNDPDPDKKIAAIEALAEVKDTFSVPRIVELLQDTVPDVRKEAATGLGKIGDGRACQPLADFYDKEKVEDVQDAGIRALVRLGKYSVEPLVGLLSSIRPVVRSGAARALGKLGARRAVDPLMSLLHDRNSDVQQDAIIALREIGDSRGLDAIASMAQDTNPNIERAAEGALSGQGYQEQFNRARRVVRRMPYP